MTADRKSLIGALSWAMPANFVVNALNVVGMLVFARILGIEVIGQYGLIVVAIELLVLPLNFGFNQAVIRFRNDQNVFSAALALVILQACGYILIFLLAQNVAHALNWTSPTFGVASSLILMSRVTGIFATLAYAPLESDLSYQAIARSKVLATAIAVSVGLAIAVASEPTVFALIIRDLISAVLMFAIISKHCTLRFKPRWVSHDIKSVWNFTKPIWLLNMLERATIRIDYALAAFALDQIAFGIYFQIRALMEGTLGFFLNPVQTVVYAYYCRVTNARALFRTVVVKWIAPVSVAVVLLSAIFFATEFGAWLVKLLLGSEWLAGGVLLGGFTLYAASMMIFEHSKAVALATHIQHTAVAARVFQLLVIVLAVTPLAAEYGLLGASVASGVAALLLAFTANGLIFRECRAENAEIIEDENDE